LQDLLLAANDQPFRFPATFTFVVRSFTVLDGIGKSLDPRFDISEISAPYARNLLLEGQPQVRGCLHHTEGMGMYMCA
jgi:predicted unusual protein kinase regulating ubiquinone biosynthesis (AarF/ABC1/UbiB family)